MSTTTTAPPTWVVSTTSDRIRDRYMNRSYRHRAELARERELSYQRGRDDARSAYARGVDDGYYDREHDRAPRAYDVAGPLIAAGIAMTAASALGSSYDAAHSDLAPRAYDVMPTSALAPREPASEPDWYPAATTAPGVAVDDGKDLDLE